MRSTWECTWETGPDAGETVVLGELTSGEQHLLVGRAAGLSVRCDDPAVEPHHALLDITTDGTLRVLQLAGRQPLTVGAAAAGAAATKATMAAAVVADQWQALHDGAWVELGASTLRVRRTGRDSHEAAHVRDGALIRSPRVVPRWDPDPLEAPQELDASTTLPGGIVPALAGLLGAGVIAWVTGQPMFLLFGALGALVAVGSWAAQRIGVLRHGRRSRRHHLRSQEAFADQVAIVRDGFLAQVAAHTSTASTARAVITGRDERLWARRAGDADAFVVALGIGSVCWRPPLVEHPLERQQRPMTGRRAGWLPSDVDQLLDCLPITVAIEPSVRLAVRGPRATAHAVVRSLVLQLAANCGPADVRMLVLTQEPSSWSWIESLPHATGPDGSTTIVGPTHLADAITAVEAAAPANLVIITDAPELLAARTSPLRRAISSDRKPALIAIVPPDSAIPHVCRSVLSLSSAPIGRWVADTTTSALPEPVRFAGIGERAGRQLVVALASISDPDDPLTTAASIPRSVGLLELIELDTGSPCSGASVAARWLAAGPDPGPRTALGMAVDGVVDIDLVRDGPHALIAGTTGAGKSELLRSLVAGMAAGASPDHLTFILIDYKGGSTFDACASLPHVVGVITDLDDHLADRALRSLHAELRRREALLREHSASDLPSYLTRKSGAGEPGGGAPGGGATVERPPLPRLVVVIDEFAALVSEQPEFLHALVGVAQRGRSLGVHLLLATQRPNGVISDDIRANTNIRLALRLHDVADAVDVIGDAAPTLISRRLPGRAVLRLGPDEYVSFQTARCTGAAGSESELDVLVRAVHDAVRIVGVREPVPPWRPPLPTDLDGHALPARALGLIDDPDHQRIDELHWRAEDGDTVIAGGAKMGVTSALIALAQHALAGERTPEVYVIDGRGDELFGRVAQDDRCVVVRGHERERLMRLLHRLDGEVRHRITSGDRLALRPVLLLIDGYHAIRQQLDDLDSVAEFDALERVICDGHGVGVTVVLGVSVASGIPASVLARCRQRWMLHLADRFDATSLGFAPGQVPPAVAGRVAVAGGLHAQLRRPAVQSTPHDRDRAGGDAVEPIECLPAQIDAASLPQGRWLGASSWLPLGPAFVSGGAHVLEVPDGEHAMVLGPARSGRSTALARLVAGWRQAHPGGWVGTLCPRRSAALPATHPTLASLLHDVPDHVPALLAIDDADLVVDEGDALAGLAAQRRPDLLIVAVATPDTLRQTYGHWTATVRRSRLGLVTAAANELDGDLLGASLPRRLPVRARPGLVWVVASGEITLVQMAHDDQDAPSATQSASQSGAQPSAGPPCASNAATSRAPATAR